MKTILVITHNFDNKSMLYDYSIKYKKDRKLFAEVFIYKNGLHSLTINKCINYRYNNLRDCTKQIISLAESCFNSEILFTTKN